MFQDILAVGEATGRLEAAERLVDGLKQRLEHVKRAVDGVEKRPRVVCLEWADPPFVGGHWVPEMVKLAGGLDVLGTPEKPSFRITWDQVLEGSPDVIVIMPCGYPLEQVEEEWRKSSLPEGWSELPAVREGRVYAVDANSFFSRPGPRLVTGVELLAHLFHPTLAPVVPPHRSFTRV